LDRGRLVGNLPCGSHETILPGRFPVWPLILQRKLVDSRTPCFRHEKMNEKVMYPMSYSAVWLSTTTALYYPCRIGPPPLMGGGYGRVDGCLKKSKWRLHYKSVSTSSIPLQQIYNHIMGLNLKHGWKRAITHSIYIYYSSGQPCFVVSFRL
jgi:hypothetical protein